MIDMIKEETDGTVMIKAPGKTSIGATTSLYWAEDRSRETTLKNRAKIERAFNQGINSLGIYGYIPLKFPPKKGVDYD